MPSAKAKKIQKQIPDQARFAHQEDKAGSSSPAALVTQKENGSFIDGALSAAGSESPEYPHLDPCRHPASLVTCGRLLLTSNSLTPGASTGCSDFSFYSWLVLRSCAWRTALGSPFPTSTMIDAWQLGLPLACGLGRAHSPWSLRGVTPLDFPCGLLGAGSGWIYLPYSRWVGWVGCRHVERDLPLTD